ncbi:uncharacterized protein LOC103570780 [Microplitis demolitor]|uniref:uncharacterized protein LOC103570780 n=1 Tax=Microplitis demolitor TaxID=69319 RepID=UPI0004CDC4F0|nr:uncharacterized protein LOC103570780 [Microplitis demolitor]
MSSMASTFSWVNLNQYQTSEERNKHLENCNNVLTHAMGCSESNCPVDKCDSLKSLLAHSKQCNVPFFRRIYLRESCELCKNLFALRFYHAKVCDNLSNCNVEGCGKFKKITIKIDEQRKGRLLGKDGKSNDSNSELSVSGGRIVKRTASCLQQKISEVQLLRGFAAMSIDKESSGGDYKDDDHEEIKIITYVNGDAKVIKTYKVPNFKKLMFLKRRSRIFSNGDADKKSNLLGNPVSYFSQIKINNVTSSGLQARMIESHDSSASAIIDDGKQLMSKEDEVLDGIAAMNIDEPISSTDARV